MSAHAFFHPWPGVALRPKHGAPWAAAARLRERRIALARYLAGPRGARWMTEEEAAAERRPNLLEDNPSSG